MKALKKLLTAALVTALPLASLAQPAPTETAPPPAPPAAPAKPAAAPAPLVTIYGTLNVNLQYTRADDATAGSAADVAARTAVSVDSSNIGFRGSLGVTPGLNAVYQCETSANVDGIGVAGLCNRNSRVGLSGNWGTLFYGNWDTPFKAGTYGTKADDPFGNTDVFGFQGIMSSPGFNARSTAWGDVRPTATFLGVHSFDLRAGNSVAYWTPKFAGLSGKVQYSTDEFRSANGVISPMLVAAVVNYDVANFSLVAAGEYHEDGFGLRVINPGTTAAPLNAGTENSRDMAWRVAAGYDLPIAGGTFNIMGMFEQLIYEQENATAGITDFDRLAWLVGAKFRTGAHEFRARYSQALDPNTDVVAGGTFNEDDLAAMQYALGYSYHVAKSTQVYAFFTQILNDDRAQYTFTVGGAPGMGGGTPAGADPMALGLGIRHAF